jgi:hypothetical protein
VCGLITSTLANLFVLPGLCVGFAGRHEPEPLGLDAPPVDEDRELVPASVG